MNLQERFDKYKEVVQLVGNYLGLEIRAMLYEEKLGEVLQVRPVLQIVDTGTYKEMLLPSDKPDANGEELKAIENIISKSLTGKP